MQYWVPAADTVHHERLAAGRMLNCVLYTAYKGAAGTDYAACGTFSAFVVLDCNWIVHEVTVRALDSHHSPDLLRKQRPMVVWDQMLLRVDRLAFRTMLRADMSRIASVGDNQLFHKTLVATQVSAAAKRYRSARDSVTKQTLPRRRGDTAVQRVIR